jgi:hypothetical protein
MDCFPPLLAVVAMTENGRFQQLPTNVIASNPPPSGGEVPNELKFLDRHAHFVGSRRRLWEMPPPRLCEERQRRSNPVFFLKFIKKATARSNPENRTINWIASPPSEARNDADGYGFTATIPKPSRPSSFSFSG